MATFLDVMSFLISYFLGYVEAFWRFLVPRKRKAVKGKVVLITGAGSGIGKCLAIQFAELGCKIAVVDINEHDAEITVNEITTRGGVAVVYKCDVSDYDAVKKMAANIRKDIGHPEILVNNAAFVPMKEVLELTQTEIEKTMSVNVLAHFWTVKEFLPNMLENNSGHIVTVASLAGKTGICYSSAYSASKQACIGYTECLIEELRLIHRAPGVYTTTVLPSTVNTKRVNELGSSYIFNAGVPVLEAEYVAERVVDGVLRNKREIYLPASTATIDLFKMLVPRKCRELLLDFSGLGIHKKEKRQ